MSSIRAHWHLISATRTRRRVTFGSFVVAFLLALLFPIALGLPAGVYAAVVVAFAYVLLMAAVQKRWERQEDSNT